MPNEVKYENSVLPKREYQCREKLFKKNLIDPGTEKDNK